MPTLVNPRQRIRSIFIDTSNPNRYVISISREERMEDAEGRTIGTKVVKTAREVVRFVNGVPQGNPLVLNMLAPVKAAADAVLDQQEQE